MAAGQAKPSQSLRFLLCPLCTECVLKGYEHVSVRNPTRTLATCERRAGPERRRNAANHYFYILRLFCIGFVFRCFVLVLSLSRSPLGRCLAFTLPASVFEQLLVSQLCNPPTLGTTPVRSPCPHAHFGRATTAHAAGCGHFSGTSTSGRETVCRWKLHPKIGDNSPLTRQFSICFETRVFTPPGTIFVFIFMFAFIFFLYHHHHHKPLLTKRLMCNCLSDGGRKSLERLLKCLS